MHPLRPDHSPPRPTRIQPASGPTIDSSYVGHCFVRMKTKLTLYVDQAAVRRGKLWARRRGIPLSRVVEDHLRRLAAPDAGERFLAKWRGAFKFNPESLKDERVAAIVAKHLR
jgi:hypothetical protein